MDVPFQLPPSFELAELLLSLSQGGHPLEERPCVLECSAYKTKAQVLLTSRVGKGASPARALVFSMPHSTL